MDIRDSDGEMTTSLTIVRLRNLQKEVARMGLTHKHVRRDLTPNKMAAVSYLTDAVYEFGINGTTKTRNKWDEYMVRIVNAESTIQLHRVIAECSGWLDMLDDYETNKPKLANDT